MNRIGDPRYMQPEAKQPGKQDRFELGVEPAPTFIAVLDKTQELDGRLSALVNELLELDARLNGATPANHQKEEPDEAPPAGTLAQLCRVTDNMDRRLHLLGSVVGRLKGALG